MANEPTAEHPGDGADIGASRPGRLWSLAKLAVSLALLGLLAQLVDLEAMAQRLAMAAPLPYLAALAISFVRVALVAWRWQLLLAAKGLALRLRETLLYYFVGGFYNLLLPTVLGGDAVRILLASRRLGDYKEPLASAVLERVLGFLSLSLIAGVALLLGGSLLAGTHVAWGVGLLFAVQLALLAGLLWGGWLAPLLMWLERRLPRVGGQFSLLHATFVGYRERGPALTAAFALSFAFQFSGIVSVWLIGLSLGLRVDLLYYLIFMPLVWVAMMVPLTISGLGVREGAFVALFTLVGVSSEEALLLSLLFYSLMVVHGLLGGLVQLAGSALGLVASPRSGNR